MTGKLRNDLPRRTRNYVGESQIADIWADFDARADDVFICTPPKSGTTWMQAIVGMLIFADAEIDPGIGTTSRWLDSNFNDPDEVLTALAAQTHRRYIKTHTPLDGITYDPRCSYICVYRHPLDVGFSAQNHLKNMKSDALDQFIMKDVDAETSAWLERDFDLDQSIGETLASLVEHYKSFRVWRDLPNIHLFHYVDMKRDLRGAVEAIARALSIDADASLLDDIATATTFSNMKAKADTFAPSADRGIWKDNAGFFQSASDNKWEGVLSDTTLSLYDRRMDALLSPETRAWLERGENA